MVRREARLCSGFVKDLPHRAAGLFYDFEYDSVRYAKDNNIALSNAEIQQFNDVFCRANP
jgi:hypothetical protein